MNRYLLILITLFSGIITISEAKVQTKSPTKAPTNEKAQLQIEMQGMLYEMQLQNMLIIYAAHSSKPCIFHWK